MLEGEIEKLNKVSKCRYSLNGAYGKVRLDRMSMECTGVSVIGGSMKTKLELYDQIQFIFIWLNTEKNDKMDYVKNCTHHDVFNIYMGQDKATTKHNASHIRENERTIGKGKNKKTVKYYQCTTCKKEVTKAVFDASNVPKSPSQLANMRFERK